MTSPAVTARPQWSVVEAARAMARHNVKRLPVVDDAGHLMGIVVGSRSPPPGGRTLGAAIRPSLRHGPHLSRGLQGRPEGRTESPRASRLDPASVE